jgi:hypothetical protein
MENMQIKVIGKMVEIEVVDEEIDDDECILGQWCGLENKIRIRKRGHDDMSEVLLHELMECIKDRCDLKLPHQSLSTLSEVLYQVLKENAIKI